MTGPVTSPTFTLVRAYPCFVAGIRTLLHADLYRLDRIQDVVELGLAEMVEDDSVAVIEWGDVASSVFGPEVLTVQLTAGAADEDRRVTLLLDGSWPARRATLLATLGPWTSASPDGV